MKTVLPSSHSEFTKEKIIEKLFLVISLMLCFGNSLYAGAGPIIKHDNKNIRNAEEYNSKASYSPSKIKHAGAIAPPTILYSGGPQAYLVGTAINPLTPTSSGVAATAFASPTNIGAGFNGPRGLAIDAAGNVYVADLANGQVKKIPAGGGAPVNWGSGFSQPIGVALDAAGNVYVVDYGTTTIKKIPPGGGAPVIIATGFTNPVAIAADAAGNVFVADNNVLWRIPFGGSPVIFIDNFSNLISIALDAAGNVYAGDATDQRIYKITPGGVPSIFASNMNAPIAMALDGEGNMFVGDATNHVLSEIPANGGPVVTVSTFTNIVAGVCINTDGSLYVSDYSANAVKKINLLGGYHISPALPAGLNFDGSTGKISGTPMASIPATDFTVTAYNSTGSSQAIINIKVSALNIAYNGPVTLTTGTVANPLAPISSGVAAPAYSSTTANFGSGFASRGIARDAAGNIYIADYTNDAIWKMPVGGGAKVKVGPSFNGPLGVAVDAAGNIFVAEYDGDAIKKIPAGGGAVVTLGSGFINPRGVAVDGAGNIFVVDVGNHAIKEIPAGGGAVINLGSFPNPLAVTVDAADNVYFSDAGNGIIYKIPASGGAPVAVISGIGTTTGIDVDAAGNLFFADGDATTIKELPANGFNIISVGPTFSTPSDVVVDGAGNLYVSERNGPALKKIVPVGGYYINGVPKGMYFDSATGIMSGTPTLASTPVFYNITAYNSFGSNSASVSIQVNQLPLPIVSYTQPPINYSVNTPVPPLAPVSTGVAAPGYIVAPYTLISGLKNPIAIALDGFSNLIMADAGTNLVRRVPPGSANGFAIGNVNFNYPSGVAIDVAGDFVYVADQLNNSIKKIVLATNATTVIGSGFNNPCGVALDAAGNVYVADKGNNAIKKIAAVGGAVTIIGSGFSQPSGVVVDAAGNVYVADYGNNAIKMIPAAGGAPVTLGGGFSQPSAIALDASGNLYIADTGSSTIQKMPTTGGTPVIISTSIVHPLGIAVDGRGVVYVADNVNGAIKQIIPSGGYYISPALPAGLSLDNTTGIISGTPIAVTPSAYYHIAGYNSSGGGYYAMFLQVDLFPAPTISYPTPQSFAKNTAIIPVAPVSANVSAISFNNTPVAIGTGFSVPNGVAVDNAGNVYVADKGNGLVKKIQKINGVTVSIGSGINNPNGVAVDGAGNVFVADNGINKIFKIPVGGGATTAIGGNGFVSPSALALDSAGNVYVSDSGDNTIKKIPANGTATVTIATGFGSLGGIAVDNSGNIYVADASANAIVKVPADGTSNIAVASGFNQPIGVAVDAAGNIFVADFNNNAIKMVPVDGSPMAILGSGFNHPYGVAVDGAGNVYTSDYLNSAVKKIIPVGGYFIAPGLPAGVNFDNNTGVISGTPTAGSAAKDYTVTGYNVSASGTAKINIVVNLFPPPTVNYSSPQKYTAGKAIPSLNPTASGVAAVGFGNTAFTISPVALPYSIAVDAAGNVYVGERVNNTVKKIPYQSTTPVIIASGFNNVNGIATDAAGNIYVADGNSTGIKKIPAGGGAVVTVGSGFINPYAVTLDAAGNIYAADQNNGNIYKMNAGGGAKTLITHFSNIPAGIAVDAAGNLFVALTSGQVQEIPADGSPSVNKYSGATQLYGLAVDNLGNIFVADFDGNQVTEIFADQVTPNKHIGPDFFQPIGVALDAMGNLYVAEYGFGFVKKVSRNGGYYTNPTLPAGLAIDANSGIISGTPAAVSPAANYNIFAFNGSGAGTATVNIKINAAIAAPNISYTTPHTYSTGSMIAALSPTNSGGAVPAAIYSDVSTLAGSGVAGSANGTGAAATFTGLMNMATDAAGNIYAADYTANVIRKITPAGVATTLAGSGAAGNANGTGTAATFKTPFGIAVDAMGNVYVGDSGNHLIRKITPAGVVTTFAGSGGTGNVNGTGTAAKFNVPRGLAFDGAGNLYVADYSNNLVRKITPAGVVTTLAGSGAAGNVNGTGAAASFSGPMAVTTDGAGNVYVADNSNNLIRKITPAGVVTTLAGSGAAGSANGTGTAASFTGPYALTADGANNIYEADGQLLRRITPAGVTTTLAGSTSGLVNATGTAARFNNPRGIATDDSGNLYVSDFTNHVVRKVLLTGYDISPALPAGLAFDNATGVISGTPTGASVATNYTVTAYNTTGSDAAITNIEVLAAPNISYTTPNIFSTGSAIAALSPTNTGSAVPATIYSDVSTLAGSGVAGSANGTGAAATFTGLMNMATDAAGNIYAADYTANVIRKITPAGVATTLAGSGVAGNANGTGAAATFKTPFGIAVDAMGNVYVGDSGNHLIRKITPAGVVTTFAGSGGTGNLNGTGTAAKFNVPRGLAFDGAGNLYVADYSNNLIRKITPAGVVTTLAGSGVAGNANGTGAAASFSGPMAVTTDGAGNVYVADNSNNLIRKITPAGVVTTLAGSGAAGSANGTGTAASFTGPYALTADGANNIYEADGQLLRKITPAGVTTTLAGSVSGLVNAAGTAAKFNNPRGIATDDSGNLYVSDFTNHVVRKVLLTGYAINPSLPAGLAFNSATGIISGTPTAASAATDYTVTAYIVAGSDAAIINIKVLSAPNISYTTPHTYSTGSAIAALSPTNTGSAVPATIYSDVSTLAGSGVAGNANGTGAAATFTGLMNMATDAAGNIYAADYTANVIRKITPAGVATTLAGSGAAGNANGTGAAATFKTPFGIAVDAMGNVYVGDSGNHLIRKITPAGVVTTFAGSGGAGNLNGTGTAAKFNVPRGLAFDAAGNLYVADYSNNLVRMITPAGVVTTLAGSGAAGNVNATGTAASFSGPMALTTDGAGNVYVADNSNNLIRKITPAGVVTTLAGSGAAGSANGTGTAASFTGPYALTADGANNIYEADGQLLRKITPAGVTTTLAGSVSGLVNGAGTAARFNNPRGIATDDMGNLYVSDFTNHVVRKVLLTGYTISPALPAGLAFSSATGTISGTPTAAVAATNYTVAAYNASGSDVATVNITTTTTPGFAAIVAETPFEETAGVPQVKQGISPNGDGIGDVLEITNIGNYPENTFQVIGRSGALVYSIKGYDNVSKAFDGHSNINGKLQQAGTCFYQLEYNDKGKIKRKTGFILIKY